MKIQPLFLEHGKLGIPVLNISLFLHSLFLVLFFDFPFRSFAA